MKRIIETKSGKQIEMVANLGTNQFYKYFTGSEIEADAIDLKNLQGDLNRFKKVDPTTGEVKATINATEHPDEVKAINAKTMKMSQSLAFVMSTQAKFFTQDGFVRKTMDALTEENFIEFLCSFEQGDFDAEFYKEVFALWRGQTRPSTESKNT